MNARREIREVAEKYGYRRMTIKWIDHYVIGPGGRTMSVSVYYSSTGNVVEAQVFRRDEAITSLLSNERDKRHKVLGLLRRWRFYE